MIFPQMLNAFLNFLEVTEKQRAKGVKGGGKCKQAEGQSKQVSL